MQDQVNGLNCDCKIVIQNLVKLLLNYKLQKILNIKVMLN